MYLKAAGYNT